MSEHFPECPVFEGPCCPWMGDCECQCMCDFIGDVEKRVLNSAREAVAEVDACPECAVDDALAAIDALRGEVDD